MSRIEHLPPLVTIGIPTFNRPAGLAKTIERAVNQSYRNIEILVADNCSEAQDEIIKIMNEYKNENRLKHFIHKKHMGAFYNFEFLLRNAKGKYFIWFPDDDDYYDDKLIERYVATMELSPVASAAMASVEYVDGRGEVFIQDNPPYGLDGSLSSRLWNYLTTNITDNVMYGMLRTDTVKDYHFERDVFTAEKFLILHLLSKGPILDCHGASYKNIYSFKSQDEIIELLGKLPSRNHHIVWLQSAWKTLPLIHFVASSLLYIIFKLPKISWPFRKILSLPAKAKGRVVFFEPVREKMK